MQSIESMENLKARMVAEIRQSESRARVAINRREQNWHRGHASGLREALVVVDIYDRCQKEGCAVEMRSADFIIGEVELEQFAGADKQRVVIDVEEDS